MMRIITHVLSALALLLAPGLAIAAPNQIKVKPGEVEVFDGGTIKVGGHNMRLKNLDTANLAEPRCDKEKQRAITARDLLSNMVSASSSIIIAFDGTLDKKQRYIVDLIIDGENVSKTLLKEGLAFEPQQVVQGSADHWCY